MSDHRIVVEPEITNLCSYYRVLLVYSTVIQFYQTFQGANIIRRRETLEAIHYHAYPLLWGVVGPLLMIDVVLCEELHSFVAEPYL